MDALRRLEDMGYEFTVPDPDTLHYSYEGPGDPPNEATVSPLLETVGNQKYRVLSHLKLREAARDVPRSFETTEDYVNYLLDPRPDLEGDAGLWRDLLFRALRFDDGTARNAYRRLHLMRCGGAKLEQTAEGRPVLRPRLGDPSEDVTWTTEEDFREDYADYIEPHERTVKALLYKVGSDELERGTKPKSREKEPA